MSLTHTRQYFRDRMNFLGYEEWDDAFNVNNVPETVLDGAYHIDTNTIVAQSMNQTDLQLSHNVTIRLLLKGYRYPKEALDKAYEKLDAIYVEILKPSNRLTGTNGLRNVLLVDTTLEPLNAENDNAVLVSIRFNCQINICTTD